MNESKQGLFSNIFSMMINPSKAIKSGIEHTKWYYALLVSGTAFALFYLQTALDLFKTGQKGLDFVFMSIGIGTLYGIIVIPLIGILAWLILKITKTDKGLKWTISAFCLSYSGALIYGILGSIFSLFFAWKTAITFGVTGVIWAIGPMIITTREMTKGKLSVSVVLVTVFSTAILISWAFFNQL